MALDKYNGFVAGDILPAENVNSVDPDNIESPVSGEAFRIIRADASGLLPAELLVGVDGSGLAGLTPAFGNLSKDSSSDTTTTIAHGLGRVPKLIRLIANYPVNNAFSPSSIGAYNGSGQYAIFTSHNTNGNINGGGISTSYGIVLSRTSSSTGDQLAGTVTVDATNITITWAKTGTPAGTFTIVWEAV